MMDLPEREEEHSFLNNKKQEVYAFCESKLANLYNDKYITNGFYEKLLLYYENGLRSTTSTLEIKNTGQFWKAYNGLIDNPIKRTPVEIRINKNPVACNPAK